MKNCIQTHPRESLVNHWFWCDVWAWESKLSNDKQIMKSSTIEMFVWFMDTSDEHCKPSVSLKIDSSHSAITLVLLFTQPFLCSFFYIFSVFSAIISLVLSLTLSFFCSVFLFEFCFLFTVMFLYCSISLDLFTTSYTRRIDFKELLADHRPFLMFVSHSIVFSVSFSSFLLLYFQLLLSLCSLVKLKINLHEDSSILR